LLAPGASCSITGTVTPATTGSRRQNADPSLRHTPPETYQYQVTASSTSGVQLSQIVTLNLTVTAWQ
jgi:hypothetical protein